MVQYVVKMWEFFTAAHYTPPQRISGKNESGAEGSTRSTTNVHYKE